MWLSFWPSFSSRIRAAPAAFAPSGLMTAGRISYSTTIASRASSAWYLVSATTAPTSLRWMDSPIRPCMSTAIPLLPARNRADGGRRGCLRLGGVLDGLDDVHVTGAAANVAGDRPPDLFFRWVGVALEQRGADQHHAGSAEPALQTVLLVESGLHR